MGTTTRTLPTVDRSALDDLVRDGYAVIPDVLAPETVDVLADELATIARSEREDGTAILEDGQAANGQYRTGANQRVTSLLAKGRSFRHLAGNSTVLRVARRLFADAYAVPPDVVAAHGLDELCLSSVTANIANAGGSAMTLHADQGFVPPSTPYPILVNALWPLVDFRPENGATQVAPGSHVHDPSTAFVDPPVTVPVIAAAGSVILLDGRTWHGTGINTTRASRPAVLVTYCRPWVRPFAPHLLDIDPALLGELPEELVALLGCRQWFVFGHGERAFLDRTGRR